MSKDKAYLSIIARPKNGFRRAGINFSSIKPTIIPAEKLSESQIEQLISEPNLVVVETGGEPIQATTAPDTANAKLEAEKKKLQTENTELQKAKAKLEQTVAALQSNLENAAKNTQGNSKSEGGTTSDSKAKKK